MKMKKNVKKNFYYKKKNNKFKTFHFKVNLKGKKERKMVRLFNLESLRSVVPFFFSFFFK